MEDAAVSSRTVMTHARHARRRSRSGFTLVEMMIALTAGAIVVATVYTIGASSARHFQEQQRVSQLQLAVRLALDRIRRDAQRAAFQSVADSALVSGNCGGSPSTRIRGVVVRNDADHAVFTGMPGATSVQADQLDVTGNFRTGDTFLVRSWNGSSLDLQTQWQGYRRTFSADPATTTIDTSLFAQTFSSGTPVLVRGGGGQYIWTRATSSSADSTGTSARVNVSPSFPDACRSAPGIEGWCQSGCTASPVTLVRYQILPAPAALQPRNAAVTGANTVLYRTEYDPLDPTRQLSQVPILEYAVHFDVDLITNTAATTSLPVVLTNENDTAAEARTAGPLAGRVRGLRVSIAARTPEQDPHLSEGVSGLADGTPRVFRVFGDRAGAARVRSAYTEIFLPNM